MRTTIKILLALATLATGTPAPVAGQDGGFNLASLDIPEGFLDLSDLVITARQGGGVSVTATTTLLNAETYVLIASSPPAAGKKRRLTVGLKPNDWSLTKSIPPLSNPVLDNLTLSNVGLILAGDSLRASWDELAPEEYGFYRQVFNRDEFEFRLKPGINLIAAIPLAELEEGDPLLLALNALGIEQADVLLQGTLGKSLSLIGRGAPTADIIKDLYLRAELPPVRPPGSPAWFKSGQVALELTGDPSVRLVGELTVQIQDDVLVFFVATTLAKTGMSLAGGLLSEEGWDEPFGIPWLIINEVVLKIGVTPTGSIQLGFGGDMVIGEKDIDVAVAVAVNAATGVPTNFIFEGESEAGFGMPDLVELQARMAAARDAAADAAGAGGGGERKVIPLDRLPQIAFTDVGLKFAPKPEPDLGIGRGVGFKGRLWLQTKPEGELTDFAGVDVNAGEDGLWVRGDLGAFTLGPLVWNDAKLDLTATREEQYFMISGEVELFASSQLLDVMLSRDGFSFQSDTRLFGLFGVSLMAESVFDLKRPVFKVQGVAQSDFSEAVVPLVMDGLAGFAENGERILESTNTALGAAEAVLANQEATTEQLKAVLEAQRARMLRELQAAEAEAAQARSRMASARRALNSAVRAYRNTPARQVRRKAQRARTVATRRARFAAARSAYIARASVARARQRIYDAIPAVAEQAAMVAAQAALDAMRERVRAMRDNLAQLQSSYSRLVDAMATGQPPLSVTRASFSADLEDMVQGRAFQWDITGTYLGRPMEIHRELNFADAAQAAADLFDALIRG